MAKYRPTSENTCAREVVNIWMHVQEGPKHSTEGICHNQIECLNQMKNCMSQQKG